MFPLSVSLSVATLVCYVAAASTFSPVRPPALPLAVKSPYLSTWLSAGTDDGNGGYLAGQWPTFWLRVNGWASQIRVDGLTYTWMGSLPGTPTVNQTSYEYTSTSSVFSMRVGDMVGMKITFLSPITPDDLRRQSLIFSYLSVEVESIDGNHHDIQVYSDISAEWVSGDRNATAQWDYGVTDAGVAYHKIYRQTQHPLSEFNEQAEWGEWYWATEDGDGMTYQSGADADVRGAFAETGMLANSNDMVYRSISTNWPVFAFSRDLGLVKTSASMLFSIGLAQDSAIQYSGKPEGTTFMPSLWKSYFSNATAALELFHHDYNTATALSKNLDSQIAKDSIKAAGQDYLTITSLTVRQVFAAVQLTGTTEDPYIFMKEISSNGNTNTVDVVFPAHPIFLYMNPELLKLLLKPIFEIQENGKYPNTFAMHDIGAHYPNATGHPDGKDEEMPLEECGNMVIMALAYAMKAKDNDYLSQHYSILKKWTTYLVKDALYPANQISTDDFAGPLANQTNLALKGIIGIQAMAVISNRTLHPDDAVNYSRVAKDYILKWQTLSVLRNANPPHTTLSYGANETYGLLYNLTFYPTVKTKYGVSLDTRHSYTKADWELFAAAIASVDTRDMFHKALVSWMNGTPSNRAFTGLYDTTTGDYPGVTFIARPVVGGAFALLVLEEGLVSNVCS
ncbi:hypothetical protein BDV24DRAFT_156993 [Aspergillus arachidicola]|uniref:Glutaminase GtaA n=1 Tax=Aspergillus arachidicola TaxID=656916 RepID=A0A5N6XNB6_9EURO|nr:hypothetical protein BDV24DRAFT_156993 [Aspergillus arachidicola]